MALSKSCVVASCTATAFKNGYCVDHIRQFGVGGASSAPAGGDGEGDSKSLHMEGLKLFEGFRDKTALVRVYAEAARDFTGAELKEYTATFVRFDVNKSGDLDQFELNKMYEAQGQTKTASELNALIASIGEEFGATVKKDGVTFKAYLSVLLKDKKGLNKAAWGSFAAIAVKLTVHDESTKRGKLANIFEKEAHKQATSVAEADRIREERKARVEVKRAEDEMNRKKAAEKAQKQAALARFNAQLNGR